jgi:hypothetical protein
VRLKCPPLAASIKWQVAVIAATSAFLSPCLQFFHQHFLWRSGTCVLWLCVNVSMEKENRTRWENSPKTESLHVCSTFLLLSRQEVSYYVFMTPRQALFLASFQYFVLFCLTYSFVGALWLDCMVNTLIGLIYTAGNWCFVQLLMYSLYVSS